MGSFQGSQEAGHQGRRAAGGEISPLRPRYVAEDAAVHRRVPQRSGHPRLADHHRPGRGLRPDQRAGLRDRLADDHRAQSVPGGLRPGLPASLRGRLQPQGEGRRPSPSTPLERFVGDFGIEKSLKLTKLTEETHPKRSPWWARGRRACPAPTNSRAGAIRSPCSRPSASPAACCATAFPSIGCPGRYSTRRSSGFWIWASS